MRAKWQFKLRFCRLSLIGARGLAGAGLLVGLGMCSPPPQGDDGVIEAEAHSSERLVQASAGALDTSFSGDGKQLIAIPMHATGIAIQSDGKIVLAGPAPTDTLSNFAVARLNRNGTRDTSFGSDGKVITQFSNASGTPTAVAIQTDGKIVVAGTCYPLVSFSHGDFCLARYNQNGTLDLNFNGGRIVTNFGQFGGSGAEDFINAMALQPDGKIIVAGFSDLDVGRRFAIARYNANGTLDTTFSGDGKVMTLNFDSSDQDARAVAIQGDGKIVVAGVTGPGAAAGAEKFAVARLNTNGSLDTTFNGDGKATFDIFSDSVDTVTGIAIAPNGKIVMAGWAGTLVVPDPEEPSYYFYVNRLALVRLTTSGVLDTSFDGDGIVTIDGGGANAVAVQVDGKIVALRGGVSGFSLIRFNRNGALDTGFGSNGQLSTDFGEQVYGFVMAIQPKDGRLVVSGDVPSGDRMPVARYHAFTCGGFAATLVGTAKGETLMGSAGSDVIVGVGGNDTIYGLDGNDVLCGSWGDDTLDGGAGTDYCDGGANYTTPDFDRAFNCEVIRNIP